MGLLDKFFSKSVSKDDFAKIVLEALSRHGKPNATYNPKDFSITAGDNNTLFLNNSFANYNSTADKARRAMLINHLVGGSVAAPSVPASYAEAAPNLMPIVRAPSYFSLVALDLKARSADAKASIVDCHTKPICEGLVALLAYDTEHSIMQVNRDTFAPWNVSLDDALSSAVAHLREKTDDRLFRQVFPGVYHGEWGDSYESARILLPDLIYRMSVEGDPIAFLPSRDQLWLTGSLSVAGQRQLLEMADKLHFAGHPLSPHLFRLDDGKWSPYLPDDPALRTQCLKLIRKRDAVDYNQQTQALNAIHTRDKIDLFTANFKVFSRQDGTEFSSCVWSNGIDSLLPKTDAITFGVNPEGRQYMIVPWDDAFPIIASLLEEQPGLIPVRYRARQFPGADQLAQLRPKAIQTNKA